MASFTGVGDNVELTVPARGTEVDINISGTYNMTILFQREMGSPGSGAWETINTYSTANATVAETYTTKGDNEKVRLYVSVDTSGTATATLADNDNRSVKVIKDAAGNEVTEFKEGGMELIGAFERGDPVSITADITLTAEEHAGRTMVFGSADGDTITLPAATGTGNIYRFYVGVTVTSNNDIIQVANATDEFVGNLFQIDTDTSDGTQAYPALDGDGFDTITLNGTTKGGIMGDFIEIEDVAAGKFSVRGIVLASGIVASMFSAAVS